LIDPASAQDISINLGQGNGGVTERAIQLIALLTVLSIAPSILIMMTSFTASWSYCHCCAQRSAQPPPAELCHPCAGAVPDRIRDGTGAAEGYDDGIKPLSPTRSPSSRPSNAAPFRCALSCRRMSAKDLKLFMDLSGEPPVTRTDVAAHPDSAFMISELKRAFEINFLLFLPFLIIDLVVASVLMSMGMMMLPPSWCHFRSS
jgi:flagellar biosynthetic protein FliP